MKPKTPPTKKAKAQAQKSPVSSTPPPEEVKPKKPAKAATDPMAALLQSMQQMMAPMLAFHASSEAADTGDVCFMWEIKMLKSKGEFFGQVTGTSTMPGLLAPAQLHLAADRVGAEMTSKVVVPVTHKFQALVNEVALAEAPDQQVGTLNLPAPEWTDEPDTGDDVAAEAERISSES